MIKFTFVSYDDNEFVIKFGLIFIYSFIYFFRLPSPDRQTVPRKSEYMEPAHVLTHDFSRTVSPVCCFLFFFSYFCKADLIDINYLLCINLSTFKYFEVNLFFFFQVE